MKFKVGNITKSLLPLAAGAVGASVITGMVKKFDKSGKLEKFAPAVPILIGGFLVSGKKTQMLGYGLMAGGAAKLAGNLIPGLAGIEDMDLSGVFGDLRIGEMDGTLTGGDYTLSGDYDMSGADATLNGIGGDYDMSGYHTY